MLNVDFSAGPKHDERAESAGGCGIFLHPAHGMMILLLDLELSASPSRDSSALLLLLMVCWLLLPTCCVRWGGLHQGTRGQGFRGRGDRAGFRGRGDRAHGQRVQLRLLIGPMHACCAGSKEMLYETWSSGPATGSQGRDCFWQQSLPQIDRTGHTYIDSY